MSFQYDRTGLRPWEESLLRAREEDTEEFRCEDCETPSEESQLELWDENTLLCSKCFEKHLDNEEITVSPENTI